MSTSVLDQPLVSPASHRLRVVLCGSFRRDLDGLRARLADLSDDYLLLSPAGLDFVNPDADFVRLSGELDDSVGDIESRHLRAISDADFVWLHAPQGYVGLSAALELGHARAVGVPIFSDALPEDETLASIIRVVSCPEDVAVLLDPNAGAALERLQSYYRNAAARRGWDAESAQDALLMMTEELGELARAVRRTSGLSRDGAYPDVEVGSELADVQLYLVHLANILGVDLASAVTHKERINAERFSQRSATAA
jgi:NTP pyrophosphatase (non-canonical NTP hydrolase)